MSTVTPAVVRILRWAIADPKARPPHGDAPLRPAGEGAAREDPAALAERLAAVTAARLRLSDPPLGDPAPTGLAVLPLAAALALAGRPETAAAVLGGVPLAAATRDELARHGLVGPVLALTEHWTDAALRLELRRRSPLTGLLDHPAPGAEEECRQLLDRLLDHPEGRVLALTALAEPPREAAVAHWRAALLRRYRFTEDDRRFVYGLYETALLHHRTAYLDRTARARRTLTLRGGGSVPGDGWARAMLDWWAPLAELARRHPGELRHRLMLRDHLPGMWLHQTHGGLLRAGEA